MSEVTLPVEEVDAPVHKVNYTFKIRNFDKLIRASPTESGLSSSVFGSPFTPEVTWSLKVYPNGANDESSGFVSVFLYLESPEKLFAAFSLSIGKTFNDDTHSFDTNQRDWGWDTFVAHRNIKYVKPGEFVVTAAVEYKWGPPQPLLQGQPKAPDLSKLLFSKRLSDFSLEVDGEIIHVHKALLASASPVFDRMFAQTTTSEAQTNSTTLQETSAGAVKLLLRFAYTGRLEEEKAKPIELREVADVMTTKKGRNKKSPRGKKPQAGKTELPPKSLEESSEGAESTEAKAQAVEALCGALGLSQRYDVAGLGAAAEAALAGRLDEASLLPVAAAADLHGFPRLFDLCRKEVTSGRLRLDGWRDVVPRPDLFHKLTLPQY